MSSGCDESGNCWSYACANSIRNGGGHVGGHSSSCHVNCPPYVPDRRR